jgi:hypothetical protein
MEVTMSVENGLTEVCHALREEVVLTARIAGDDRIPVMRIPHEAAHSLISHSRFTGPSFHGMQERDRHIRTERVRI